MVVTATDMKSTERDFGERAAWAILGMLALTYDKLTMSRYWRGSCKHKSGRHCKESPRENI